MRALVRLLRSPLWLALPCLLGSAHVAAAADAWVVADFDGDGFRDRAALDRRDPSILRVWLSTTHRVSLIHSGAAVVGVGARDLDGDRRDELIVGTRAIGFQVWTTRRHGLTPFRPWHARRAALARAGHAGLDDQPSNRPIPVASETPASRGALPATPSGQPILIAAGLIPRISTNLRSALLLAPSGPRPPPLSA